MSIIVNSRISFVFALMKCSFAAFGEQNKIDNDSKCQQVYKSRKKCKTAAKVQKNINTGKKNTIYLLSCQKSCTFEHLPLLYPLTIASHT